MKVFVTDVKHRHSQIIIRSLQKAGYEVFSCVENRLAEIVYNVKNIGCKHIENFECILNALKKLKISVIMPVTLNDYEFYSKKIDVLNREGIKILITPYEKWNILRNKNESSKLANKVGIPIPKTILLSEKNYLSEIHKNLKFPMVIKVVNEGGSRFVAYANNESEVKQIIDNFTSMNKDIFKEGIIAQEYIKGESCGYFCLSKEGKIHCEFGHIRIRENPPSGGVSSSCESFYNKKMFNYGRKIIKHVKYTGVCMIEFKYDKERDEFFLIEINPKFWGSILLSIVSGVNFPVNYVKLAMKNKVDCKENSFRSCKIQHVASDFSRTLKYRKDVRNVILDFLNPKVKKDIFYIGVLRFLIFYFGKNLL